MRIAFRADGDEKKGMGHLMRCGALASALINCGDEVCFFSEYSSRGLVWLQGQGFTAKELSSHKILEDEAKELVALLKQGQFQMIFIDSYWLSEGYFDILAGSGIMVIAIDDNATQYHFRCDVIINGNIGSEMLEYNAQAKYFLTGLAYNILREEFVKTQPARCRDRVNNILITMGGADINNYSPVVLSALRSIEVNAIKVVYGPLMNNLADIQHVAKQCYSTVEMIHKPSSMAELMTECDLAIAAGGGTVRELFSMGIPSLFVLQSENQLALTAVLKQYGLPLSLGYYADVQEDTLTKAVLDLINDYPKRFEIRKQIMRLIPKNGVSNIINGIKKFYLNYYNKT